MSVEKPVAMMHRGEVVYFEEGGLIPGSQDWPPGVRYDRPAIVYFDPTRIGPRRRRWWGGHFRHGMPSGTNLLEIHLGTRARAERWLRRAGPGRTITARIYQGSR